MPELVGFQTMVILDPKGMTFDAGMSLVQTFDFYLNLDPHTVVGFFRFRKKKRTIWSFNYQYYSGGLLFLQPKESKHVLMP